MPNKTEEKKSLRQQVNSCCLRSQGKCSFIYLLKNAQHFS